MARKLERWVATPSNGGLVTALKSVADERGFRWLGWPGTNVVESEREAVTAALREHGSEPVFLGKAEAEGFYEGFSNRVLWPLLHGMVERSHFSPSAWRNYCRVNEKFADAIVASADPGEPIWIHDYQLALLPEMLRKRGVRSPIGFFLHIPFPSFEVYRTLAVREDILRGLLGADVIGFHAYEYVSHFRTTCLKVLGIESEVDELRFGARTVNLGVIPIGIDPLLIDEMKGHEDAIAERHGIQNANQGKKVMLGVDRLDYTKGIPEKLLAFEELLRTQPKWRGKVVLIQVAAPSREAVADYQNLKRHVEELVGRINGQYGSPTHTPVVYINKSVSRTRLVGMYQAADIALVTPLRDGMNLVALEYVAARGEMGGCLVLSEFAGSAHLLSGARLISPYNQEDLCAAMLEGLTSEPGMDAGFAHMVSFVGENTAKLWAQKFLSRLESHTEDEAVLAVPLDVSSGKARDRLESARQPLVLLDYDGTLRRYESQPMQAKPTAEVLRVLRALSAQAVVYVVSGRQADVMDRWLGDLPIGMVCEHGLAIRDRDGEWTQRLNVSGAGLKPIEPILEEFVQRTPGSLLEKKSASIAWHYRASDPEYGTFQAHQLLGVLEDALNGSQFNVLRGRRVIEVRHVNATKGDATAELLRLHSDADVVFAAGDDRTDEEMMEVVARSGGERTVTCWVGGQNASAEYWVEEPEQLLAELTELCALWGGRVSPAHGKKRSSD